MNGSDKCVCLVEPKGGEEPQMTWLLSVNAFCSDMLTKQNNRERALLMISSNQMHGAQRKT